MRVASTSAVAALLFSLLLLGTLAPVADAQSVFLATAGMTPVNATAFPTLASVIAAFPADAAAALGLTADRAVVYSSSAQAGGAYSVSLNFVGTVANSSQGLATDFFTLAMVTRTASAAYTQYLAKYGISSVDLSSMAVTTTTAPTAPPPTSNVTVDPNATTVLPVDSTTAPAFTPVPTAVNPDQGNQTYEPAGGGGDDSNNTIYAIIFGILGVLIVVAGVTFCIKHFAKKEKKDTSKRGGGYKYATRNAQHI